MPGSRRLLAAGGPGLTRRARLQARARLHDTILCRNRLRRLAGFCRAEGSPPHQGFGGAVVHGSDPSRRFAGLGPA